MNFGRAFNTFLLVVSSTWDIANSENLRHTQDLAGQGNTIHHKGKVVHDARELRTKSCSFGGETREAGAWLEGPDKTCQCDRWGSGDWVACYDTQTSYTAWRADDADPNTAAGRRQAFQDSDFVFDLLGSRPGSITSAGTIQPLDVGALPSLAGQGLSFSLFNIEPCGINLPHVHPRATELLYVISGEDIRTAFVEENGGRVIVNDIGKGYTTFFPEGLIHYQQNLSCEPAAYLSALNSEDPGVVTITTQFFDLPGEAVAGSLGQDESKVQELIDGLPAGPADGRIACMSKCGLWK